MVIIHLTDDEVQQYVVDRQYCEMKIVEHIHVCGECKLKAEIYHSLITDIRQRPQPAFDFDLSSIVLSQLPVQDLKPASDKLITWAFIFICAGLIGTTLYFFRGYLSSMFKGMAGLSIYLVGISAITIIAWLFAEMYRKYQKEMRVLDLH